MLPLVLQPPGPMCPGLPRTPAATTQLCLQPARCAHIWPLPTSGSCGSQGLSHTGSLPVWPSHHLPHGTARTMQGCTNSLLSFDISCLNFNCLIKDSNSAVNSWNVYGTDESLNSNRKMMKQNNSTALCVCVCVDVCVSPAHECADTHQELAHHRISTQCVRNKEKDTIFSPRQQTLCRQKWHSAVTQVTSDSPLL